MAACAHGRYWRASKRSHVIDDEKKKKSRKGQDRNLVSTFRLHCSQATVLTTPFPSFVIPSPRLALLLYDNAATPQRHRLVKPWTSRRLLVRQAYTSLRIRTGQSSRHCGSARRDGPELAAALSCLSFLFPRLPKFEAAAVFSPTARPDASRITPWRAEPTAAEAAESDDNRLKEGGCENYYRRKLRRP